MKYYALIGSFKKNPSGIEDFKSIIDGHHAYLKSYTDKGDVLLAGPKKEGGGGVILVRLENESVEDFVANDPLVKAGIQEYVVTEFTIYDRQDYANEW